jgi:hypothetical protein
MKKLLIGCLALLYITSCKNKPTEDLVNEVPKNGSIESNVKVEHLNDSTDILVTEHKIWQNASSMKAVNSYDTIPSLGKTTVKDENGNDKLVAKDYDIYITVK